MLDQPFFIPAVLILLVALPLILGLIPRQWAIGVRSAKTLADDDTWLRANRFGGWVLLACSLIYLAAAWLMPCTAPCGVNFTEWLLHVAAFGLPILVGLALIGWYVQAL